MARDYNFWIYIVTNRNPGFAADYRRTKLIYNESYRGIRDAIAQENPLKK
jgi:predicted GIY-YIG superfamily endonuclease